MSAKEEPTMSVKDISFRNEQARDPAVDREATSTVAARFHKVRRQTLRLCEPLETEDFVAQSMIEASPVRWHVAHTTWFFEEFVLGRQVSGYRPFHPAYRHLFNSYYNTVGDRTPRGERGLLTRPTVREIMEYRRHVDEQMQRFLDSAGFDEGHPAAAVVELGMNHEQQHQELILTDLKHLLSHNPLKPAYCADAATTQDSLPAAGPLRWTAFEGGMVSIGHEAPGFSFDNEGPRHRLYLPGFLMADRLVTNREYLEFMQDGGYGRPDFWLDEGWAHVRTYGREAPLYWQRESDAWQVFTLGGMRPVDPEEPVCHVSFFEAEAYARWAGARLPLEPEWEVAAASLAAGAHLVESGNFVENERYHPARLSAGADAPSGESSMEQLFGDVWEWTGSPYRPYPGFHPAAGALGEYNGKFMINQMTLRGGSCATPRNHIRATYRNFFYPQARWQFSGLRLAREAS